MDGVSVVVPIYNTKDKLARCINSLLNQTFDNIEIVLVDDGSTDGSESICDEYSNKYKNIKTLHVENGGVVRARKIGVKNAICKYIMFCDSDDYIDSDMVETLVKLKENTQCDLVCSAVMKESKNTSSFLINHTEEGCYTEEKLISLRKKIFSGDNYWSERVLPYIYIKIYERNILLEAYKEVDDDITLGEDMAITISYIYKCSSVYIINKAFYHYEMNDASMTHAGDGDLQKYELLFKHCMKYYRDSEALQDMIYYCYYILFQKYNGLSHLKQKNKLFMFGINENTKIIIYGFGSFGKSLYKSLDNKENVKVTDKSFVDCNQDWVVEYSQINNVDFDYIVIAILRYDIAINVKSDLVNRGIAENKILLLDKKNLKYDFLPDGVKKSLE